MMKKQSVLFRVFLAVAAILAMACNDDVTYSRSWQDRLSFSTDTVAFDTVFTGMQSATVPVKVYNRNSNALKFDVRLAGGASSLFYLNTDGQTGYSASGLEIRDNDSLYCFVSVRFNAADADAPVLAEDSIVFTLQSGVVQSIKLLAYGQDAIILKGTVFSSDTVLDARRPYLIYDSLSIARGAFLTLAPGTELCFHDGAVLRVAGRISARGTVTEPIVMHGDRRDNMLPGVSFDLASGRWGGVLLDSCSYDNVFEYCHIYGGKWGIKADTASLAGQKASVSNCVIHNVSGNGLELDNCRMTIDNSQITNAGNYCVSLLGGDNVFSFCTIANYYPWATHKEALYLTNLCDSNVFPIQNAGFQYCIVTGASDDEISGSEVDSLEGYTMDRLANYWIRNSFVMSPDTLNPRMKDNVYENKESEGYSFRNFRHVAKGDFRYDFRLDSVSMARAVVTDAAAIAKYPYDLLGNARNGEKADAGCYQSE